MKKLFVALLCLLPAFTAQSQVEVADTKGKEFWFTFLPNYVGDTPDNTLRVYVTSDSISRGHISWVGRNGNAGAAEFMVSPADPVFEYAFDELQYAIRGLSDADENDTEAVAPENTELETPLNRHVHVQVEEGAEVSVYALSKAEYSSDAALILPVDALGMHYGVMSYPSDYRSFYRFPRWRISVNSKPSQFAITATQDQTVVTVTTSTTRTWRSNQRESNHVLQRGQTLLYQAYPDNSEGPETDLTGTEISANKPIAVVSGHQRTPVPLNDWGMSRDILFEQLAPSDTWGQSALLVPFAPISPIDRPGNDIYRIVALRNGTDIQVGGDSYTLDRLEYVEQKMPTMPTVIEANGPIQVAQYKQSSNDGAPDYDGDPFLMMIPPFEQFLTSYTWMNAQVGDDISRQYITIVATTASISNTYLDGIRVSQTEFEEVTGTDFVVATLEVSDGMHTAESEHPFGLYVYGYGDADSYGYVGGQQLLVLDARDTMSVYARISDTLRGEPGDTLRVAVVLDSISYMFGRGGLSATLFDSVYVQLSANPTVVYCPSVTTAIVENGTYLFQTSATWTALAPGDTLVAFDVLLGLGDMRFSEISIDSIWLSEIARSNHGSKAQGHGSVVELEGLWRPLDRDRLVNSQQEKLQLNAEFSGGTELSIVVAGLDAAAPYEVHVYDLQGNELLRQTFASGNEQFAGALTVAGMANGLYSIVLVQGNRRHVVQIPFVQ